MARKWATLTRQQLGHPALGDLARASAGVSPVGEVIKTSSDRVGHLVGRLRVRDMTTASQQRRLPVAHDLCQPNAQPLVANAGGMIVA